MRVQRWSSGRRTRVERQEEQAVRKRKREPENGSRFNTSTAESVQLRQILASKRQSATQLLLRLPHR